MREHALKTLSLNLAFFQGYLRPHRRPSRVTKMLVDTIHINTLPVVLARLRPRTQMGPHTDSHRPESASLPRGQGGPVCCCHTGVVS